MLDAVAATARTASPPLAQTFVSTEAELRNAIFAHASSIQLAGNITLTQSRRMITASTAIIRRGFTLDANDAEAGYEMDVYAPTRARITPFGRLHESVTLQHRPI